MSLVLWSGGADSTLMLHDLALREEGIRSIGVNYEYVAGNKRFAAARKALLAVFERKGLKIDHAEVEINTSTFHFQLGDGGLIQPVVWLSFAQLMLRETEDLCVGYIKGDDIWHHRSELQSMFDDAQLMTGKSGKLRFPVEWEPKWKVIERLQKLELLSLCAWCESSSDSTEACGICASCKTHNNALMWLEAEQKDQAKPAAVGCYKVEPLEICQATLERNTAPADWQQAPFETNTQRQLAAVRELATKLGRWPNSIEYAEHGWVGNGTQCNCAIKHDCPLSGDAVTTDRNCYTTQLRDRMQLMSEGFNPGASKQSLEYIPVAGESMSIDCSWVTTADQA